MSYVGPLGLCAQCLPACACLRAKVTRAEIFYNNRPSAYRRCTQRDCMIPLNRDKNGATNIGTNFLRLFKNQPPIRSMTDEDVAFYRASQCLECHDD